MANENSETAEMAARSSDVNMQIVLQQDDVLTMVRREASYVASKSVTKDDPEAYMRISIGEGDAELLSVYWDETVAEMLSCLRPYIVDAETNGGLDMQLSLPNGCDVTEAELTAMVSKYVKDMILYKWLTFTSAAMAERYGNLALSAMDAMRTKLGARRMSGREDVGTSDDDSRQRPAAMSGGASSETDDVRTVPSHMRGGADTDSEDETGVDEAESNVATSGDDVRNKPSAMSGGASSEAGDERGDPSYMRGGAETDSEDEAGVDEAESDVATTGEDVRNKPSAMSGGAEKQSGDDVSVSRTWRDAESKRRDMDMRRFGTVELVEPS